MTSLTLDALGREFTKLWSNDRGLVAECHAPQVEWPQVRKRLHIMLCEGEGFVQHYPSMNMAHDFAGYHFKISPWPFIVAVQHEKKPSLAHPLATGQPHLIVTRPRNRQESDLLYRLMDANCLVLQRSNKPTVLPASVALDTYRDKRYGLASMKQALADHHIVQVASSLELQHVYIS